MDLGSVAMPRVTRRPPPVCHESVPDILREVGQRIRQARMAALLTQEEAAHRAGVSYKRWQEIERGAHGPTLRTLIRVANTLGLSFWDLLAPSIPIPKPARAKPR